MCAPLSGARVGVTMMAMSGGVLYCVGFERHADDGAGAWEAKHTATLTGASW